MRRFHVTFSERVSEYGGHQVSGVAIEDGFRGTFILDDEDDAGYFMECMDADKNVAQYNLETTTPAQDAARLLRAIPSEKRAEASRANGAKPVKAGSNPRGRPRKQA